MTNYAKATPACKVASSTCGMLERKEGKSKCGLLDEMRKFDSTVTLFVVWLSLFLQSEQISIHAKGGDAAASIAASMLRPHACPDMSTEL